jgi:hypothetical protein
VQEAEERLAAVERDDDRVNKVAANNRRIIRENGLALRISRALGARQ